MIPRLETISSPAHHAITDGDDLHMTRSVVEEDEENFSIAANASCHTRSFAVGGSPAEAKVTKNHSVDEKDEKKGGTKFRKKSRKVLTTLRQLGQSSRILLSSKLRKKSYSFRSSTNTVAEYEEMIENEFGLEGKYDYALDSDTIASIRSSRKNVRTGENMLVRQKAQVMSRASTSHSNWEISQSPSSDSKNYRNLMLHGKSFVLDDSSIGGMSDITEDASTFYGFSNADRLSFRRAPMFINAKTYCINEDEDEDEDEDESQSESENENENEDDSEEKNSNSSSDGTIERAYDFRELSPLNHGAELKAEECHVISLPANEKQESSLPRYDGMRRRVYSDSDVDSETLLNVNNTSLNLRNHSPSNLNAKYKNQERFHDASIRPPNRSRLDIKSIGKSLLEWTPQSSGPTLSRVAAYASWPFPRRRIYSDSDVDQLSINNEIRRPSTETPEGEMIFQNYIETRSSANQLQVFDELFLDSPALKMQSRRQSFPLFESDEHNYYQSLRSRTYSDSVVREKSVQEDILWEPGHNSLLDAEIVAASSKKNPERDFRKFEVDNSPTVSPTRCRRLQSLQHEQPSTSTKSIDNGIIHPYPATSSVLASLSHTNNHVVDMFVATENNKSLQKSSVRKPFPKTLNAASKIVAALRPAPVKPLPALPTQSSNTVAKRSDQYYWGNMDVECYSNSDKNDGGEDRETELKNLCSWSSESFDDIF